MHESEPYDSLRAIDGLQALCYLLRAIWTVVVNDDHLEAQLPVQQMERLMDAG